MELSPKFGIWCTSFETGAFYTNIYANSEKILNDLEKMYKENAKNDKYSKELLDIYDFNELREKWKRQVEKSIPRIAIISIEDFIDGDLLHSLSAKTPQRVYKTGWGVLFKILQYLPLSTLAKL